MKPPGIFINEDLAEETIKKREELLPKLIEARNQGKLAYFSLDKLIVKDRGDLRTHSTVHMISKHISIHALL